MTKNIIANFIGRFWSILSNFLFIPLYIHYLGFESYSIISFTLVIAGLMAVLDAGLTATLSREFARLDNTHEEKIRVFKTLETSYFIVIGLCIIIVFALSGIIADIWLNLKTFNPEEISYFIKIISFDIGFQLLFRFYMGGLLGLEKQVKANIYQVGWGVFRNGVVVVVLLVLPTLEYFFIWQTISTTIFVIFIRLSLNKTLTGYYKFDFKLKIEKSVLKRIWKFAGGMLLISFVSGLNTQMDKIAISKLLPIESLGHYTLAVSIVMGIIVFVTPVSITLLPRFTALYSAKKTNEASMLFQKINLFVSILVFTIMVNMIVFSKQLIWIWTGNNQLAEQAYVYLQVLAIATAMLSLQIIPFNIAIANGYTKLNNLLGLVSLVVTLPGYWFVTKSYGALGAACVYCFVQTSVTFVYFYFINLKFLKIKETYTLYIYQILFPLLIGLITAFLFSFMPEMLRNNRILSFLWIATATSITLGVSVILLVPISEIKKITTLKKIFLKIKPSK